MKLFDRFDKVYCINLPHREDRLKKFDEEVKKYDLGKYHRFNAIDGKNYRKNYKTNLLNGEIGVILSNIEIFNDAKKNNFKQILILEDDCFFTDEVLKIDEYFNELPPDWDILYFGGNHNTHIGQTPPKVINNKVIKLHHTYSAHFVIIKNNMFDELLFLLSFMDKQLDVIYSDLQKKYNVYSFYPAIAKQRGDFSDIQNKEVNYDWLIK